MASAVDVESICCAVVAESQRGQQLQGNVPPFEASSSSMSRSLLQADELSTEDLRVAVDTFFMLICGFMVRLCVSVCVCVCLRRGCEN